jgi:hypothetical protein
MSAENPTIIEIKKQIQGIVSKLMSDSQTGLTEEENKLIEQISKYKVANNLKELSDAFDNVLNLSQTPSSGS